MKRRSPETIAREHAGITYGVGAATVRVHDDPTDLALAVVDFVHASRARTLCAAIRRTIAAAIRADRKQRRPRP